MPLSTASGKQLLASSRRYAVPVHTKSWLQLLSTLLLFLFLWLLMYFSLRFSYLSTLALALPAAGCLLRCFMIQHDCGHHSLFRSSALNDWTGRVLSLLTLTPYSSWRASHAHHHAHSGNLDRRGVGDIYTLTVSEYVGLSPTRRLLYRLYRNPLFLCLFGGPILFLFVYRLPIRSGCSRYRSLLSSQLTNVGLVGAAGLTAALVGAPELAKIHLPIIVLAANLGVWMFIVEHQFEMTYWKRENEWEFHAAALNGSSFVQLPRLLSWFTGNIGIHHIHHLNSRIPNYRLREFLRDHPELLILNRMPWGDGLRSMNLALWDEKQQRLVRFRELN